MDSKAFYTRCLEQTGQIVQQVQADQLANQTPDDEWTVRDLANHVLYQVAWVPDMVSGKTVAEVGNAYDGDLFDADVTNAQTNLIAEWNTVAAKAEAAAAACDLEATAHLSYTDTTNSDYLRMAGGDILIHAWDLSRAIGVPLTFDSQVAEILWNGVKDQDLTGSGLFKTPLLISDDAPLQVKILAHFGRDSDWRQASA